MADQYGLDSHKLQYHPQRIADWQAGENIYPVYMEVSPSGMCNHRCRFCALDFMGYKKRFLETENLLARFSEMGALGVRSIMFGGEGEPLLHKDIGRLTLGAFNSGIDVAFTTNAVFLKPELAREILPATTWVKVSINAGTAPTYGAIHNTKAADFDRVIANMEKAAALKKENGWSCTLGMQILLLPENVHEVSLLAEIARDIGMDYLVVKPYSQHPLSETKGYAEVSYADVHFDPAAFSTDTFQVIMRRQAMESWDQKSRSYDRCLALPFWSYLDSAGNVWGCSMFLGDEKFLYGNINAQTFQEIWQGQQRQQSLNYVATMATDECRINCRMDQINTYLWGLQHPPEHVNFI